MDEVKRMQQLAEIKVNTPSNFRKIPLSIIKKELIRSELEWMSETQREDPTSMTQEDMQHVQREIEGIYDYYDLLDYYEGQGFSRAEAMEQFFSLLVNKDA